MRELQHALQRYTFGVEVERTHGDSTD
jgi:hypothetical protein